MAKGSSSRKVARAAGTGGGRTSRGGRPWGWYGTMGLVAALGVFLVVYSRNERITALDPAKAEAPRPAGSGFPGDHWHAAFGVYACDRFLPPIPEPKPLPGIHTHGDQVIHIEPGNRSEGGRNATLGLFADSVKMTLTADEVKVPGGESFKNGDKCGAKPGRVEVHVDGKKVADPRAVRLKDQQRITIAFVPEGTTVPPPPPEALTEMLKNRTDEQVPGGSPPAQGGEPVAPPGVPQPGAPGPVTPTPSPVTPSPAPAPAPGSP